MMKTNRKIQVRKTLGRFRWASQRMGSVSSKGARFGESFFTGLSRERIPNQRASDSFSGRSRQVRGKIAPAKIRQSQPRPWAVASDGQKCAAEKFWRGVKNKAQAGLGSVNSGCAANLPADQLNSSAGRPSVIAKISRNAPMSDLRPSRQSAESRSVAEREKNSVLASTSATRANSPAVTPPMKNEMASTGKTAKRQCA